MPLELDTWSYGCILENFSAVLPVGEVFFATYAGERSAQLIAWGALLVVCSMSLCWGEGEVYISLGLNHSTFQSPKEWIEKDIL